MIEVGEYVRTLDGFIDKVIIEYKGKCNNLNCYEKHISCETDYYCEEEIIKHSKNIIDLIEVGDYVNGEKVTKTHLTKAFHNEERILCGDVDYDCLETVYTNNEIKSVVTKEQFANIEYRLEENK